MGGKASKPQEETGNVEVNNDQFNRAKKTEEEMRLEKEEALAKQAVAFESQLRQAHDDGRNDGALEMRAIADVEWQQSMLGASTLCCALLFAQYSHLTQKHAKAAHAAELKMQEEVAKAKKKAATAPPTAEAEAAPVEEAAPKPTPTPTPVVDEKAQAELSEMAKQLSAAKKEQHNANETLSAARSEAASLQAKAAKQEAALASAKQALADAQAAEALAVASAAADKATLTDLEAALAASKLAADKAAEKLAPVEKSLQETRKTLSAAEVRVSKLTAAEAAQAATMRGLRSQVLFARHGLSGACAFSIVVSLLTLVKN